MDQPSTRPLPHPPPSARRSPAYTTNGNAHASSSSSTPRPGNMSPISTDPLIPPDNVIYPHGSILNPGRSLASSKELPLPRIRFPARLRELGYGGEDGLYDWDGWMDGWRVYRPLKLPKEWKVGVWGTSPFKILAASQVFMVMDVDNRTPIYIMPPSCKSCPQSSLGKLEGLPWQSDDPTPILACDRVYPECYACHWNRRTSEKVAAKTTLTPEMATKVTCRWDYNAEWEVLEYDKGRVNMFGLGREIMAPDPVNVGLVKKKRRASRQHEGDGTADEEPRKRKKRSQAASHSSTPQATAPNFTSMSTQFPPEAPAIAPILTSSDPPPNGHKLLRIADQQWQERLLANDRRPQLDKVSGPAPVWAAKRRALSSALEYFQNPVATLGGTIDVGSGGQTGIARMVLLEGDVGEGYVFWGTKKSLGTLVLPIGYPRPIKSAHTQPGARENPRSTKSGSPPPPLPPSPDRLVATNLAKAHPELDDLARSQRRLQSEFANTGSREWYNSASPDDGEAPEINALLLAHRARTPVALSVAEDYGVVPWNVPRAFISLGWFWVTDAWPEPASGNTAKYGNETQFVRWRFRFDWCNDGQPTHPWWDAQSPDSPSHLYQNRSGHLNDSSRWEILGPGVSPSESIRYPIELPDGSIAPAETSNPEMWHCCDACLWTSLQVYAYKHYCLNEACRRYFKETEGGDPLSSRKIILRAPRNVRRITPLDLGLAMRPRPQDGKQKREVDPKLAGRDFWKGWCCDRCGMANERWSWKGWECEGCQQRYRVMRRVWRAADLWPTTRPIPTGPRMEEGHAMFPWNETTRSSIVWEDGLKVILHGLAEGTEIHHALAHNGHDFNKDANLSFMGLQGQGVNEVGFLRVAAFGRHVRPSECMFSPFYTYVCGPPETPHIPGILTAKVTSWNDAPLICFSTTRLINTLAGRIIDGEKEFNSALFLTMPSAMPSALTPLVTVPPYSSFGFLALGGDCHFSFRNPGASSTVRKKVKMSLQGWHGDLVIVRTYGAPLEVGFKLSAFGFVVIARQIYPGKNTRGESCVPLPLTDVAAAEYESAEADPKPIARQAKEAELPAEEQGWMLGTMPLFPLETQTKVEA